MTETATQLLETFDTLPPDEQHQVLTELLRRTGGLPETILSDDQLVRLADDLFQTLDAEESGEPKTDSATSDDT